MSRRLILSLFEAVDAQEWHRLAEFFERDAVYHRPGYSPSQGLHEITHFYRSIRVISSGEHRLEHVIVQGEAGACWGRFVGRKRTGERIDERFADVYTFRDKILTRRSHFFRPAI